VVNQLYGTFYGAKGYVMNNVTEEMYAWTEPEQIDKTFKYITKFIAKFFTFPIFLFLFALLSGINGLIIRFVLICSNVILIPLLYVL
jgi:hypothetical protein